MVGGINDTVLQDTLAARTRQANAEIAAPIRGARNRFVVLHHPPFLVPIHIDCGLRLQARLVRLVGIEDLAKVATERTLDFLDIFSLHLVTIDDLVP